MKIIKTYESFVLNKRFKFEEEIIDPILGIIKDNQEYLTQPENLTQLAKLGYMYDTLWYCGRICWGYEGKLLDKSIKNLKDDSKYEFISCEDNPKYKIEDCDPENEDIENLIYDAWSMHVGHNESGYPTFDEFKFTINEDKPLNDTEKRQLKINKTFEDWVEILMNKDYKYNSLYKTRKSVISSLLCTIGGGYSWNNDGFIILEAGGANQDEAIYGDWRNAKFRSDIGIIINRILSIPELKATIDTSHQYIKDIKDNQKKKDRDRNKSLLKMLGKGEEDELDDDFDELLRKVLSEYGKNKDSKESKPIYSKYYQISSSSNVYPMLDEEIRIRLGINSFHQSYVDAAIEMCKDIIENKDSEDKSNVEFAYKLLFKHGHKEYSKFIEKEVDKYSLKESIDDAFLYLTDRFEKGGNTNISNLKNGEYILYLNDTKDNQYADNSFYFYLSLAGFNLPKGYSKDIDTLKSLNFYQDLKSALSRVSQLDDIKQVMLYINNDENPYLEVKMISDRRYVNKSVEIFEDDLIKSGFQVGSNQIALELNNIILTCRKPIPLGSSHPDTKSGKECFSNAHSIDILNKSWASIGSFQMDERNFNTITIPNSMNPELSKWISSEFIKMKLTDPVAYGPCQPLNSIDNKGKSSGSIYVPKEGKECLYAHDFFLWLKDHQTK